MYTTNRFVLQELGILLGGCLTVKGAIIESGV